MTTELVNETGVGAQQFEELARHFNPMTLAGFARVFAQSGEDNADDLIEICFGIEQGNNGAAEFVSNLLKLR